MAMFTKKNGRNADNLEADITALLRHDPRQPPPPPPLQYRTTPLPPRDLDYDDDVQPLENYAPPPRRTVLPSTAINEPQPPTAEDLGKITAEAIRIAHEQAARSFELLGEEINARILKIEEIKLQALKQIAEVKELAEQHREAGKLLSARVESAASDLTDTNLTIQDMRKKFEIE